MATANPKILLETAELLALDKPAGLLAHAEQGAGSALQWARDRELAAGRDPEEIVPLVVAAAVLPWRFAWLVTLVSLAAYSSLFFWYRPFPLFAPHAGMSHGGGVSVHTLGMWFNFLFLVLLCSAIYGFYHLIQRWCLRSALHRLRSID